MEFWGVEVKAGEPIKVKPEDNKLIHISQAALGEGKKDKGNSSVPLRLSINGKKFVVGTLSTENSPQLTFDLVFEKEFELSHDWKNGSVYFLGYTADSPDGEDEDGFGYSSDEDEDHLVDTFENGKLEAKVEKVKPTTNKGNAAKPESSAKPKVMLVEPDKDDESEDEEDDSDDDEEDSDDLEGDEVMPDALDDSDDEDEETPKKADKGKKRSTESATKTPVPAKKAKLVTPQKTDGKKGGGHTATPHPSKQAGKTPANSGKKEKSPKSAGHISCNSCSKTFNSENALQSHTKDKHAAK
uniref:Putative histone deacetylase HDT1-like n=1 Tax=Davidia involucrata TaxID=16924 RepID=A0A5B7ATG2_DAVIN